MRQKVWSANDLQGPTNDGNDSSGPASEARLDALLQAAMLAGGEGAEECTAGSPPWWTRNSS